jgi:integrase
MPNERLYQRGKVWWCWYYLPSGELVRESTKCTSKEAARLVLRKKEGEAQGGEKTGYLALGDVLSDLEIWAEKNTSTDNLAFIRGKTKPLRDVLGNDTDVRGLTKKDLEAYIGKRLSVAKGDKHLSRYTVKREIKVLFQALKKAKIELDIRPELNAPYVPRKRWLTREEFDDLSHELDPVRWRWVCVAVYTGARLSEVEGLEWEDVRDGMLHIRGTKTKGSDRWVPLHPELAAMKGKGKMVEPWGNVLRDLKAACKRADIKPISPNDLRRTYASWLLQAGVTNSVVAELLGHTTTELVDITYGKLSQATLRDAVAKL